MKILYEWPEGISYIQDIDYGEPFYFVENKFDDSIYIKARADSADHVVVNLETGRLMIISDNLAPVVPVKVDVIAHSKPPMKDINDD